MHRSTFCWRSLVAPGAGSGYFPWRLLGGRRSRQPLRCRQRRRHGRLTLGGRQRAHRVKVTRGLLLRSQSPRQVAGLQQGVAPQGRGIPRGRLYPEVTVAEVEPRDKKLTLGLTNRGGGIGEIQVFVNGKEIRAERPRGQARHRRRADHLDRGQGRRALFGADKVQLTLLSTGANPEAQKPTKENLRKAFESVTKGQTDRPAGGLPGRSWRRPDAGRRTRRK